MKRYGCCRRRQLLPPFSSRDVETYHLRRTLLGPNHATLREHSLVQPIKHLSLLPQLPSLAPAQVGRDAQRVQSAIPPAFGTSVFLGEFGVEPVGEGGEGGSAGSWTGA